MIRLVASDIDGTLLQGEETEISQEIFTQIARLREKNILFCPASGRQYTSLRRLFAPVAGQIPFLCENGAVVYGPGNPGPVLGKTAMDWDAAMELCREILDRPGCEVLISGADTSYLCPKGDEIESIIRYEVGNHTVLVSAPDRVPEEIVKIAAYCPQGSAAAEPELAPRWRERFSVAVAGERWLDFTLANKGTGMELLCAGLGIPLEEVMAFGDNFNDLPMLERVGCPYVVDSASPALLRRVPKHCRRVEEVLAAL